MNKTIEFTQELHQNFIDFAYEANSQRAFADARDGLKPGQRACLWEMYDKGYLHNKPHVKSAKISGGVIANWWPHGDSAIYDTFARMSQPWINNIPEVDWHGANGSQIISGEAAASRYTEARLSKIIEDGMLLNIKKHNVPMIKNFSEDAEWPEVLPAIIPRLMINGCQGIGVTIANVWLPHNIKELYNSIINYLSTGKVSTNDIYPDFPSGGVIINKNEIHSIYETGKGKVVLRGKTEIKGNSIIITEFPYQVYVEPWIESVKKLVIDDTISDIENIYNRSNHKNGLLVEVECSGNPATVLKKLFKETDLQKSYNANQFALVGKTPKLLTLKEYYDIYLNHNFSCIIKETEFDLAKAKEKSEIVAGLIKALEDIDNIIALIKKSESAAAAKQQLIKQYDFTDKQAKAIVDMKLGRLAHLEGVELNKEYQDLLNTIENCNNIISNVDRQKEIFIERFSTLVKKYGTERKTELTQISTSPEDKEIEQVTPEDVVVILTQTGNIKRIPAANFKTQRKNGKGVKSKDDVVMSAISTNTIDNLLIFTQKGKMFKIIVDEVPAGTNVSKGVNVNTLISMDSDDEVIAITSLARTSAAKYVVFFTKQGLMKKTLLEEYTKVKRTTGIVAIKLNDGDSIANVEFLNEEDVLVITKNGMSIHFETKSVNPIGRIAAGVKSIKLSDNDEVVVGIPITSKEDKIAIFSSAGFAKKTDIKEFTPQLRGGKGLLIYKPSTSNGHIVGAIVIKDTDKILLTGQPSSICIAATEIPLLSRNAIGNIMLKANISSVVKF